MDNLTIKSLWNIDEARLKTIDFFLNKAEVEFQNWSLENLYWTLRSIKRMIYAKLKKEERAEIDAKLAKLEEFRRKNNIIKNSTENTKGKFYRMCEDFYESLTILMKEHGIFFREGDDPRFAVLKR